MRLNDLINRFPELLKINGLQLWGLFWIFYGFPTVDDCACLLEWLKRPLLYEGNITGYSKMKRILHLGMPNVASVKN